MRNVLRMGTVVLFAFGCRAMNPSNQERSIDRGTSVDSAQTSPESTEAPADSDEPKSDETCVTFSYITPEWLPINILILLDHSASMGESKSEGSTYEEIVDEVLTSWVTNPVKGKYFSSVNFGLAVFPSVDCPERDDDLASQCIVGQSVLVPIGSDTGDAVAEQLSLTTPCGRSPISKTLKWLADDYFPSLSNEMLDLPTFVVLITAGPPDCNFDLEVDACASTRADAEPAENASQCLDDADLFEASMGIGALGIPIYFIGFGEEMKKEGRWGEMMSTFASKTTFFDTYLTATGPDELREALSQIPEDFFLRSYSCSFDVDWENIPGEPGVTKGCDLVSMTLHEDSGDVTVPHVTSDDECGDGEGWFWDNEAPSDDSPGALDQCKEMEWCPETCRHIRDGEAYGTLLGYDIRFGCSETDR